MEVTSKAKESESDYKFDRFNFLLVVVGNSDFWENRGSPCREGK